MFDDSAPTMSSRFIVDKKGVRADGTIRHSVLKPKEETTSVYVIDGLNRSEVRQLGNEEIESRGRRTLGWARIWTHDIVACSLAIEVDGIPHIRHANLVGWPAESSAQTNVAQQLAAKINTRHAESGGEITVY